MKNIDIIADLFDKANIKTWGFCSFNHFIDRLIPCRALKRLPENSKTIISAIFPYAVPEVRHNVSKYAFANDYHNIVINMLNKVNSGLSHEFPEFNFTAFCDNSPIPEVMAAALCNLGVIGSNGLLINKDYGSFVFIGEFVTDMTLPYKKITVKSCVKCNACVKACPGKALQNGKFNNNLCSSFLSQKKGELTNEQKRIIYNSKLVWGCDICQNICPMNKNIKYTYINDFKNNLFPIITLENCDKLSHRAFDWRPKSVIKRNIKLQEGGLY